jgi:hypothetical protein
MNRTNAVKRLHVAPLGHLFDAPRGLKVIDADCFNADRSDVSAGPVEVVGDHASDLADAIFFLLVDAVRCGE